MKKHYNKLPKITCKYKQDLTNIINPEFGSNFKSTITNLHRLPVESQTQQF